MSTTADDLAQRDAAPPDAAQETGTRGRILRRGGLRYLLMLIVPLALLVIGTYFYVASERYASTDDAYVQADKVSISADVSGRVLAVEVRNNQRVTAGQVLFRLDDRPYRIALEHARAQLASARLEVEGLRATYRQKLAELMAAEDTATYQQREFDRQKQLLATHTTPQSKFDEARHNLEIARHQAAAVQQQIANVLASLGGDPDIETDKHPLVMQAQAQVDQAALDLSHAVVTAPMDGIVAQVDRLSVGDYLNASTPAFSLISTEHAWVEANFKETDLTHMRSGQAATVDIDTYPDKTFSARIESISAATGSEFSVLPAQNATGNWVKVVQRVPVRLAIENPDKDRPLRAGLSANVEVDTRYEPSWVARIRAIFGWPAGAHADAPRR
jgi:membrane fusion protein (multidrug efflux system)